jgi:sn-glycerol 3-phosphate transport system permease protein
VSGARRHRRWSRKDVALAAAFTVPSAVVFVAFFFYPLYRLVYLGLHQQNRFGTKERWVGWSQYRDVLTGSEFRDGLGHTVLFVLYTVPTGVALGILLAVAAHRRLRGIKVFQTIFSSTVASSVAVASVIFLVLVNPQVGYFRGVGFISLADPDTALRGVALSSIWQNLGLTFVIVLAGLQSVPEELYEVSVLDGFGPVRRFFRVTLPLISPTLLFLVVVLVIFGFQAFAQVEILTSGGPAGATETLVYKIFQAQQPASVGEGSVIALGLFGITLVVTIAQFALLERRVHYGR